MYVSPAVRSIREHPVAGESVTLVVEAEDDVDGVAESLAEVGTVEDELEFETLRVSVPHERVDEVCDLGGIAAVQTDDALSMDAGGAGEDVRFE
ncbi:MAG: hypothetical protein V5A44_05890 [Haloarculaceae archaeon]